MDAQRVTQLLCLCTLAVAGVQAQRIPKDAVSKLTSSLEGKGAKIGYYLGKDCDNCPRGALALKDYKAGDVIAEVPFSLAIPLGFQHDYSGENAVLLLKEMHLNPEHNKTFADFWQTQPGLDELFVPDLYTDEHIAMLQSPELEHLARVARDFSIEIYYGRVGRFGSAVSELLGSPVPLEQFQWLTALVMTRAFSFWHQGAEERTRTWLVPMLDMINHAEETNCHRNEFEEEQVARQIADKDIKQGEQLYQSYHHSMLHRPDMSLLVYGFVVEAERPLLSAVDRPEFNVEDPYTATPPNDDEYLPRGPLSTGAELGRLVGIKASWPTTLKEDEAALAALRKNKQADWREELLLTFRVQRKKAVTNLISQLWDELGEL